MFPMQSTLNSRPPPITGEKREATEHTEQGEMLKFC